MESGKTTANPNRRLLLVVDSAPADLEARQPYIPGRNYRCPIGRVLADAPKEAWSDFQSRVPYPIEILDGPTFRRNFPDSADTLPIVGLDEGRNVQVLLESHTLWGTSDLGHLGWLLDVSLATHAPLPARAGFAAAA
jgi:hypothetical protein